MTNSHVKWAEQHDWCKSAHIMRNGSIEVIDHDNTMHSFKTFAELRLWAGY